MLQHQIVPIIFVFPPQLMMTSTLDLPDLLRLEPDLCLSLVMLVPTIRTIQSPLKHFEAFCLETFKIFKYMNYCNIYWVNVLMAVLWVLAMFFPFSSCGIRTCPHRVNPVVSLVLCRRRSSDVFEWRADGPELRRPPYRHEVASLWCHAMIYIMLYCRLCYMP